MQLDGARAAASAATANVVALQQTTAAAGSTIEGAEAGVRLADARLKAAQAARDNAALQLSYTGVHAPESGTVSRKQVEPGQLVEAGQPLLTLVADTGIFVMANLKETQLADIKRRPAGGDSGRRVRRRGGEGMRRERQRRDRVQVRVAPAGQRHRKFHEGRSAYSGQAAHPGRARRGSSAAPGHVGGRARRDESAAGKVLTRSARQTAIE